MLLNFNSMEEIVSSQRDLNESSAKGANTIQHRMRELFDHVLQIMGDDHIRVERLQRAQAAFETYRLAQLEVFDEDMDGTSAPLKRNATSEHLVRQRTEILEAFLKDTRPDAEIM